MRLTVAGPGYCGAAVARAAAAVGFAVAAVSRAPERLALPVEIEAVHFDRAEAAIAEATHPSSTAPRRRSGAGPIR